MALCWACRLRVRRLQCGLPARVRRLEERRGGLGSSTECKIQILHGVMAISGVILAPAFETSARFRAAAD